MSAPSLHIRPVRPSDRAFLVATARRFVESGLPPWRDAGDVQRALEAQFERIAQDVPQGHALFVAESASGKPLGFIYLEVLMDFFTRLSHGHVSDVVVAEGAEGQGVGQALMAAGEAWAREQGYDQLTLTVFAGNARARAFYARLGFGEETLRLVKPLPVRPGV